MKKNKNSGFETECSKMISIPTIMHLRKPLEILKSAVKIITSNTKFMLILFLSILPLFVFMVFYEIKISEEMDSISNFLKPLPSSFDYNYVFTKLDATDKPATLSFKEMLYPLKIDLKGAFVTYICVHLMLTMTLLGILWAVSNHFLVLSSSNYFDFINSGLNLPILSITVHSVIFFGLLYKYLEWSALWNMSMVISVMGEQTGIAAFGMSNYYGKHCKKIGFQLMPGFFVFGHVLRLLCLYARSYDENLADLWITCIVIVLVLVGNLVKWVAFLLYYYYCKQQIMGKKVDDHNKLEKSVNAADLP
ncbi:uncharacterized protein LOC110694598 [Chenopodium quinoa]|uniref:uncharacterized protein LOC110694598 n=1 Tax=Chenopodium quinoa TaxID=63459 RepID=UPI000B78E2CB|nr:uncharacterized protein LOC110694598 [Chenopodium quinoa]